MSDKLKALIEAIRTLTEYMQLQSSYNGSGDYYSISKRNADNLKATLEAYEEELQQQYFP